MKEIKQIVAENLVALRKKSGLTQNELAEKMNYSDNSISRWERGDLSPSLENLQKFSEVYNVPIEYLLKEHIIENLTKEGKSLRARKICTVLLCLVFVWFLATSLFVYSKTFLGQNYWLVFIWALPLSCLVLLLFNRYWGKFVFKSIIMSAFLWSTILGVYLAYLKYNMYLLFILAVPLQIALILWAFIKPTPRGKVD